MKQEHALHQTDGLLLTNIQWNPANTCVFPALIGGLGSSMLQVAAFFSPPGPNPDEACFFVPDDQIDRLMAFCRRLRDQTGVPFRVRITGKTLMEGSGWPPQHIRSLFLDGNDSRTLLYLGKDSFVACCDEWEADELQIAIKTGV